MKRPWDDEPTPWTDELESDADYGLITLTIADVRNEEKRRRAAEKSLADLVDAIESGDGDGGEIACADAVAHLAAAREEDER